MESIHKLLDSIENKTLLAIYPHPDDEIFAAGGLLMIAKEKGWKVKLLCLTAGDAGKNALKTDKQLSEIRMEELDKAVKTLGINDYEVWSAPDGKLRETVDTWREKLKGFVLYNEPGLVVTYDHSGVTGHPDHIVLSLTVLDICEQMESPPVLLWTTASKYFKKFQKNSLAKNYFTLPTHFLDLDLKTKWKKVRAFMKHKSQLPSLKKRFEITALFLADDEVYHRAEYGKKYDYEYVPFEI